MSKYIGKITGIEIIDNKAFGFAELDNSPEGKKIRAILDNVDLSKFRVRAMLEEVKDDEFIVNEFQIIPIDYTGDMCMDYKNLIINLNA